MKKEKTMMALYVGCLAVLCACTESQEFSNEEGNNDPVELQINPTMTLTGGGARDASTTSNFGNDATIGVFAVGADASNTNYGNGNNYAVYKHSGTEAGNWSADASSTHIYLTSEVATIYAVSPSSVVTSAPSDAVTATSTVNIETFAGGADAIDTSNGGDNLITAAQSATNDINIAPGETDYLYAGGTPPQASNGKEGGSSPKTSSVNLTMEHALAMVSFRVYKTANYKGAGHLTKIQMKNSSASTSSSTTWKLQKAGSGSATMQIGDGTIALGTEADITYTRFIHQTRAGDNTDKYYELKEAGQNESTTATVPAFGILLYSIAWTSGDNSDIEVIFTVDGTGYTVPLALDRAWVKGNNYIYSAALDGEGLSLGSVTITDWKSTSISNGLDLIEKPENP